MLSRAVQRFQARLTPRGWKDLARQVVLFGVAYYAYQIVRGAVEGQVGLASWHATELIWLEHQLHLFIEPSVQAWTLGQEWLADFTALAYVNLHFVVTFGSLAWIYLFRNRSFYFVRNMFLVAMGLALVGYVLFPTAPPRLMPEWGFTDPVAQLTGVSDDHGPVGALVNAYAAVPSMHVCFALLIGLSLARLVRRPALKLAWRLYPLLVTYIVVATGNHYLMDAVLGAFVAGVSALAAGGVLARLRPRAWRFLPAAASQAALAAASAQLVPASSQPAPRQSQPAAAEVSR